MPVDSRLEQALRSSDAVGELRQHAQHLLDDGSEPEASVAKARRDESATLAYGYGDIRSVPRLRLRGYS